MNKKNKDAPAENPFAFSINARPIAKNKSGNGNKSINLNFGLNGLDLQTGELANLGGGCVPLDPQKLGEFLGLEKSDILGKGGMFDATPNCKIYEPMLKILVSLRALPAPVAAIMAAASNSKADHCSPDFKKWGASETNTRMWLKKLTDEGVIRAHPSPGRFWINLGMVSGCNRAKKFEERKSLRSGKAVEQARSTSLNEVRMVNFADKMTDIEDEMAMDEAEMDV